MLSKPLSDLVAHTVTTMSDRPAPTAMEILTAFNRLAEAADRIGYERGDREGYARGVVAGQRHVATAFDRVMGTGGRGGKGFHSPDGRTRDS